MRHCGPVCCPQAARKCASELSNHCTCSVSSSRAPLRTGCGSASAGTVPGNVKHDPRITNRQEKIGAPAWWSQPHALIVEAKRDNLVFSRPRCGHPLRIRFDVAGEPRMALRRDAKFLYRVTRPVRDGNHYQPRAGSKRAPSDSAMRPIHAQAPRFAQCISIRGKRQERLPGSTCPQPASLWCRTSFGFRRSSALDPRA